MMLVNSKSKTDKAKQPIKTSSTSAKTNGKSNGSITSESSTSDSRNNSTTVSGSLITSGANGGSTAPASATPKVFRFEGSISSETYKTSKSFDLAGVNILNRKPLDTKTALDKLQRRRETHNRVERKRRDCINQLVDDLTKLLPAKHLEEATSKCHRVNVLRGAVAHITFLTQANEALVKSLKSIKGDDFDVSGLLQVESKTEDGPATENKDTEVEDESRDMSMEVDADVDMEEPASKDGDDKEDEDDKDDKSRVVSSKKKDSSSKVPSSSSSSTSSSPRLTPSRAMELPPVIVTDAASPASDRALNQKVPPISISTAPTDSFSLESHPGTTKDSAVSPSSAYSKSPMFPPSPYSATASNPTSPFMRPSATSPSLPPISSLANLHLQSPPARSEAIPAGDKRRSYHEEQQRHQHYPEHLSPSSRPTTTGPSSSAKLPSSSHRTGPTLPPLKIPAPHHLHPSYSSERERERERHSQSSTSPKRHQDRSSEFAGEGGEQQPPVSPFMLSPMLSRSPSIGPLSASSAGNSPYPHWGHEETPAHHGHYGAPPPAHGYPHGYPPYPYAYHPSYGYPPHHPHAPPPPPHHHHHAHHSHPGHGDVSPALSPRHSSSNVVSQSSKSLQPEPIFIQEEPWVVQRKRSSSNVSTKNPPPPPAVSSGPSGNNKTKKNEDESHEDVREESAPLSPSSSVTSNVSSSFPASPNHRKRSSNKVSYDEGEEGVPSSAKANEVKRIKQQKDMLGDDLEEQRHQKKNQRDSGIVVVVVEAESETATASRHKDQEMKQA
ncbi:hypothetical protein BGZ83_000489 [Gryganskiella cystojenkinii]|nr:hypothetical protein BGZ83_000489 [Gryganskiella cystojenkinii]